MLFTEILNCDRTSLFLNKEITLNSGQTSLISSVLRRRISGEPLQYIIGETEFMGLEFKVTPDVFIPRPETEILVETAIKQLSVSNYRLKILDLGTGSGNIAVALAKYLPQAEIYATDISNYALEIARTNAKLNRVEEKIKFVQSDLFTAYSLQLTAFDLIVSNPPYITEAEIEVLQPEIRYEPRIALDGGKDGLDFYRRIIKGSGHYLKKGGFLILEMGFRQAKEIRNIFKDSGIFKIIDVMKDYNNIKRVVVAQLLVKMVRTNG